MTRKRDVYQEVTNRIIELIESGAATGNWMQPWATVAGEGLPVNAVTHRTYRGVNVVMLWGAAMKHGYPTNEWATFRQWASVDARVRKGEHGERVVFFRVIEPKDDDVDEDQRKRFTILRDYSVFNADQVEGFTSKQLDDLVPSEVERQESIEDYLRSTGATIRYGGGMAAYSPSLDQIVCPKIERFKTEETFYSVLFHELTHWTGHGSRLARDLSARFGDHGYAAEELIAELGSAFQSAYLGLEPVAREDHAEYVAHWLRLLRDDKKAIVTAASKASDAADYLKQLAGSESHDEEGLSADRGDDQGPRSNVGQGASGEGVRRASARRQPAV